MAGGGAALEPLDAFRPQPRMSYKVGGCVGLLLMACRWAAAVPACAAAAALDSSQPTAAPPLSPPSTITTQDGFQKRYFSIASFEEGAEQLRSYCRTLEVNLPGDVRAAVGLGGGPPPPGAASNEILPFTAP